jgi:hypothetical protein
MVAPELGEPLLLYISAMMDSISMVLVIERQEPLPPLTSEGATTSGSGFQDPQHAEVPREGHAVGSHEPEATPAPKPKSGPSLWRTRRVSMIRKLPEPSPWGQFRVPGVTSMGGSEPFSAQYTTSVKSSMMPR